MLLTVGCGPVPTTAKEGQLVHRLVQGSVSTSWKRPVLQPAGVHRLAHLLQNAIQQTDEQAGSCLPYPLPTTAYHPYSPGVTQPMLDRINTI